MLCLDILTFSLVSLRIGKPAYVSFAKLRFVYDLCIEKLLRQLLAAPKEGMQSFEPVQHFGQEDNVLCLDILTFSSVSFRVRKPAYVSFAKLRFVHDLCVEKL
jgi:hypothetical protein